MSDEADQITTPPAAASPVAPGTLDRSGVPFDPARHIAKTHPRTGNWMPRGGRKPKAGAPSSPSPASSSPADSSPSPSSPSGAGDAPAASTPAPALEPASFADFERIAGAVKVEEANAAGGQSTPAPAQINEQADDIAEIIANAFYNLAGFIFDAPEEWGLSGAEHNRTCKAIAAYVRTKNGAISPLKALVILGAAYMLRGLAKPKSRAKAKEWTAKLRETLFRKKGVPAEAVKPAAVVAVAVTPSKPRPGEPGFDPFAA